MALKGILSWVNPTQYEDGTPYNQATDGMGYELAINSEEPTLSLPFALGNTFDLRTLEAFRVLPTGQDIVVKLRVVAKDSPDDADEEGEPGLWASLTFRKTPRALAPASLAVA